MTIKEGYVCCTDCGIHLIKDTGEGEISNGIVGIEKGFIYKNPLLFTGVNERFLFCNRACYKSYYERCVPKNTEVSKALEEVRKNIPAMAKKTTEDITNFIGAVNKIRNNKLP